MPGADSAKSTDECNSMIYHLNMMKFCRDLSDNYDNIKTSSRAKDLRLGIEIIVGFFTSIEIHKLLMNLTDGLADHQDSEEL